MSAIFMISARILVDLGRSASRPTGAKRVHAIAVEGMDDASDPVVICAERCRDLGCALALAAHQHHQASAPSDGRHAPAPLDCFPEFPLLGLGELRTNTIRDRPRHANRNTSQASFSPGRTADYRLRAPKRDYRYFRSPH